MGQTFRPLQPVLSWWPTDRIIRHPLLLLSYWPMDRTTHPPPRLSCWPMGRIIRHPPKRSNRPTLLFSRITLPKPGADEISCSRPHEPAAAVHPPRSSSGTFVRAAPETRIQNVPVFFCVYVVWSCRRGGEVDGSVFNSARFASLSRYLLDYRGGL